MKKTFGIFLAVCLLFALLPAPAMAADEIEIEGILYTIENQEAIVTGYDQDPLYEFEDYWTRTFVIPEAVNGAPVTRVADGAFDRSKFRALEFPASLRVVGNGAFTNCSNLASITFSEGLTEIGGYCFDGSGELRTLQLPSTLRTLGIEAFSESGLAAIDLPEGLESLPDSCFYLCRNLMRVKLPSTLKRIGELCFDACTKLASVEIPDSVVEMGKGAFMSCEGLSQVTLGKGLTTLPEKAFYLCKSLKSVEIPENIKCIETMAFDSCSSLEQADLPETIESMGGCVFRGTALKTYTFPECMNELPPQTFERCTALETVYLPDTILKIGESAFYGCSSLKYVRVPRYVTVLPWGVFAGCSSMEYLTIPATIRSIEFNAFPGCDSLKGIEFGGTEEQLNQIEVVPDNNEVLFETTFYLLEGLYPDYWYGFYDMPDENDWSYEGISFCLDNELMNGMGDGLFQPNGTTTRAQLVTILWRMCEEPAAEKAADFRDTRDHWAKNAVAWAAENGIVNGVGEGLFAPDAPITREQLVTIFHRFCGEYLQMDVSRTQALHSFPDAGAVSDWAKDAMAWGAAVKLISGVATPQGAILQPQGSATRAQIAKVILNFFENVYTE